MRELPARRSRPLQPLDTRPTPIPFQAIQNAYNFNPIAKGLDTIGEVVGQRAQLRKQGQQLAAIQQMFPDQTVSPDLQDPAVAVEALKTKAAFDKIQGKGKTKIYVNRNKKTGEIFNPATGERITELDPEHYEYIPKDLGGDDPRTAFRQEHYLNDLVTKFNGDKEVQKARQTVSASANIRELVDSGNPIAAAAIPTYMARLSGEVGNLSEADKRPFGGSRAMLERFQQALTESASGGMSPGNQQFVRTLADKLEGRANANIDMRARTMSKQHSRANPQLKERDLYESFNPGGQFVMTPQPSQTSAPGGQVKIRASDGSLHLLPAVNLDKARQRDPGLQVIQ